MGCFERGEDFQDEEWTCATVFNSVKKAFHWRGPAHKMTSGDALYTEIAKSPPWDQHWRQSRQLEDKMSIIPQCGWRSFKRYEISLSIWPPSEKHVGEIEMMIGETEFADSFDWNANNKRTPFWTVLLKRNEQNEWFLSYDCGEAQMSKSPLPAIILCLGCVNCSTITGLVPTQIHTSL